MGDELHKAILGGGEADRERIRVLHLICPTGFYGAERWILALASSADKFAISSELAVTSERPGATIEVLDRFPGGPEVKHRLDMRGRFDMSVIFALLKLIKRRNVQIVHTHGYKSDLLGLFAAFCAGTPCISTPHGFGYNIDFKLKTFIRVGGFALRYFDKVSPLSEELVDDVRKLGVPESKIRYIANGTDIKEIDGILGSATTRDARTTRRIGYVGQLIARKRVDQLLASFDALWREDRRVELMIVGDGSERADLEMRANRLESRGAIFFTGYVEDRLDLMTTFDLFVMTSASEGVPRCAMEAMGLGLPVLAYDIPGVDQLITHEHNGVLVQSGDVSALTRAMRSLLDDADRRTRLGKQARSTVVSKFSASRMAVEYEMLYREVLRSR